jgi:hypothetical protein
MGGLEMDRLSGLGCALLALSILAFGILPGLANADTWMVNKANVTSTLLPAIQTAEVEEMSGTKEKYMSLTSKVLGVSFEVRCTAVELVGAKLETEGRVTSGSKAKFSGCVTYIKGLLSPPCEPHTGAEKGVIRTKALKGGLSGGVIVLVPVEGKLIKVYEMGEECALGEQIPVEGQLSLKDGNGEIGSEKITHLVESGPSTVLTIFTGPVTLAGSAWLELAGAHKGMTWSGLP